MAGNRGDGSAQLRQGLMVPLLLLLLSWGACARCSPSSREGESLDELARRTMDTWNKENVDKNYNTSLASWAYDSNLTESNKAAMVAAVERAAELTRQQWGQFQQQGWPSKWRNISDPVIRRQFQFMSTQGMTALPAEKFTEYNSLVTNMSSVYSKAKVDLCVTLEGNTTCKLNLEPELTQVLTQQRDYGVLQDAWVLWRDVSGKQLRSQFVRYTQLSNEAAKLNNFTDASDMWLEPYQTPGFKQDMERLWLELRPLYQQVHAYVRRKLRAVYGEAKVSKKGPIPAHLLGNMWAQQWDGIGSLVMPYPNKPSVDVTAAMKKQGYTPLKMFQLSNKFFMDLNLKAVPPSFWEKSIIEKPPNTELVCHASAWDFSKYSDVRIKMCTDVTMAELFTIHHEMGHIQYDLQYEQQPLSFRSGANPGFHEAVGDSLALSVQTPGHLHKVGLLDSVVDDREMDINFLMNVALTKVVFLPFGYLIDKYRWDVFTGKIATDKLNCEWWNLRYEMQGLKPPVLRTEADFDPGAKYHVVASVPYIRYFVSFIVQFQFHKAMCLKAGQYDPNDPKRPLHKCDIDSSKDAGNALAAMLELGASRPWPDALETLTGSRKLDVSVLREYFQPLEEWLKEDNKKSEEFVGWEKDGNYCT